MSEMQPPEEIMRRFTEGYISEISCGEGWWPLITELDAQLNDIDPGYTIFQVKEKFGALRFYACGSNPLLDKRLQEIIRIYELKSSSICEVTGKAGFLQRKDGRYRTLCSDFIEQGWSRVGSEE